jgi:filamentous hemagglutinin family protein
MFPNHPAAAKAAFSAAFSTMAAAIALLALSPTVYAGPTGGTVTAGTATINQSGAVTNIDQSTTKAIIDWQSFSIAKQETVNFNQPSASAATLNRVTGNERSVISGALNANGQVFIVNSADVLFS